MDFFVAAHTDVGIKKQINQDSILIETADTDKGKVCLAVLCDGMGGLQKGELASAVVVRAFSRWFEGKFPELLYTEMGKNQIKNSMEHVLFQEAAWISRYAKNQNIKIGTTATVLLLTQEKYYILHIGDTRVYEITDQISQLTKDQTLVQSEVDQGKITEKEAKTDKRRNILLQCVGVSDFIEPEFLTGTVKRNAVYLLCSDGFRHAITREELYQYLNPTVLAEEEVMENQLVYLTELNKYRNEEDNISAVVIRT